MAEPPGEPPAEPPRLGLPPIGPPAVGEATPPGEAPPRLPADAPMPGGQSASGLAPALAKADDKTLKGLGAELSAAIAARNDTALSEKINKLIDRCRGISKSFRSGFDEFCNANKEQCVKR